MQYTPHNLPNITLCMLANLSFYMVCTYLAHADAPSDFESTVIPINFTMQEGKELK